MELLQSIVRGKFTETSYEELERIASKGKMMMFVSSTFVDLSLEREILHHIILPDLQKKAKDVVVLFYDPRYGQKGDLSSQQIPWETRKAGLRQCRRESDALFFVSLQGDRYGECSLPKYLDETVLLQAFNRYQSDGSQNRTEEILKVLKKWYLLDENHLPAQFELRDYSYCCDPYYFQYVLPLLRDSFLDSLGFEGSATEELLVNRSSQEWENFLALSLGKEDCCWIQRVFSRSSLRKFQNPRNYCNLTDASLHTTGKEVLSDQLLVEKLGILKTKMESILPKHQHIQITAKLSADDYFTENNQLAGYLKEWERATRRCLEENLEKVLARKEEWQRTIQSACGIPAKDFEEILFHYKFASSNAKQFIGREKLVEQAVSDIAHEEAPSLFSFGWFSQKPASTPGITLAIIGKSGTGKTALISKIASELGDFYSSKKEIPVIVRFCGTTRSSCTALQLIQSISCQLLAAHQETVKLEKLLQESWLQKNEKTAVEEFHQLLAEYPVFLFLDGLDQLEIRRDERIKLSFLKDMLPHEKSRIVVSCSPDDLTDTSKGRIGCETDLKAMNVPILRIDTANDSVCALPVEAIIEKMLDVRDRQLTPEQMAVVLQATAAEPTMLYLSLAVEVISAWRSFEEEGSITSTVKGIIHQIFESFEKKHGVYLVSAAFGLITFSREGVSDSELQDLLSLHSKVMNEVSGFSTLASFPIHLWLDLKQSMMRTLLQEREHHCLHWAHKQLKEVARERYAEVEHDCHSLLGRYFSKKKSLGSDEKSGRRCIQSQSRILNGLPLSHPDCQVNRRRVVEGYFHLLKAGLHDEAAEEICSLEFVCASALCGDLSTCLRSLSELLLDFQGKEEKNKTNADHYFRWVRRNFAQIAASPAWMVRSTAGEEPEESVVRRASIAHPERRKRITGGGGGEDKKNKNNWSTCTITTCAQREKFSEIELEFSGHSHAITAIAWSSGEKKMATGSKDASIKLYDARTGELLRTLEDRGDSKEVACLAWSPDSSRLVSGSKDAQLRLWDAESGQLVRTLEGHTSWVTSVAFHEDGLSIISGSLDKTVRVWHTESGKPLKVLKGHISAVLSVACSEDGSLIASGSQDRTVKIWHALTGELLHDFTGHRRSVTALAWRGSEFLASASEGEGVIKVWEPSSGMLVNSLVIDKSSCNNNRSNAQPTSVSVASLAWGSGDDHRLYSFCSSGFGSIHVWEADSGRLQSTLRLPSSDNNSSSTSSGAGVVSVWSRDCSHLLCSGGVDGKTAILLNLSAMEVVEEDPTGRERNSLRRISSSYYNESDGDNLLGHCRPVLAVAWNHSGRKIATGGLDRKIRVWDARTGGLLATLEGHSSSVTSLCWSPSQDDDSDGSAEKEEERIVSASKSGTINIWDAITASLVRTLTTTGGAFVHWSRDGQRIFSASDRDGTIDVWDAASLEPLNCFEDHPMTVIAWSGNGHRVALVPEKKASVVEILDGKNGKLLLSLKDQSTSAAAVVITCLAWSSTNDTRLLASGAADHSIKLWEAVSGRLLKRLEGHVGSVTCLRWNHDDSLLVSASEDKTLRLWDTRSGESLHTLFGHADKINSLAWNLESSTIASVSDDKTVKLWSLCL